MNQYPIIHINGQVSGLISVLDRGFAYGDGFFETCRVYKNKIHLWDLHLKRLVYTAERLAITLDPGQLQLWIDNLLQQTPSLDNAILKIQITRGTGARGYAVTGSASPTIVLFLSPTNTLLTQQWIDGVSVRICEFQLSESSALAGLKHLNRLENILARAEWKDEYAEGLLFNQQGYLIEGTMSNIFLIKDGQLITPDLSRAGVAGVMRENIITKISSKLKIECQQKNIVLDDLLNANEIFICNSLIGIWPVNQLDADVISTFTPGKMTRELQTELYRDYQDDQGDNRVVS
jgi:4-amino-4-deoxychorismate lyase